MATITGVTGNQYPQGSKEYEQHKYQYATSSYQTDMHMEPQLIVYANNKDDIAKVLKYAKAQKVAVAIRTGGHQYSGASSTDAPNIQLDLKKTFRGVDDQQFFEKDGKAYVRTSVSWSLGAFHDFLGKHKIFVPHGQCINVHLGGHVQTGGYGQLGRSFGLFGDHVLSLEIVDHNGDFKEVTRATDPELFYAILGGSPGNLCVITHFTLEVHRDEDHKGSRGVKSIYWYDTKTLNRLLDLLVQMSDDDSFPRNYDLCISVLSSSFDLLDWFPDIDEKMRDDYPEIYGDDGIPFWPRMIVVYAQWVPFSASDVCDMSWFDLIRKGSLFNLPVKQKPMSELTGDWLFRNVREFDKPYIKRTHATNSRTLGQDGWAKWVTDRIDAIVKPDENKCWVSAQLQCFGGKNTKFFTNRDNGTSFSWRDSSLVCTLDCFYEGDKARERAVEWHRINDAESIGPQGNFSKQDKRVLWGSYGEFDLDQVWNHYFEDREKYERLREVRRRADPDGVFTPNTFCVKR